MATNDYDDDDDDGGDYDDLGCDHQKWFVVAHLNVMKHYSN